MAERDSRADRYVGSGDGQNNGDHHNSSTSGSGGGGLGRYNRARYRSDNATNNSSGNTADAFEGGDRNDGNNRPYRRPRYDNDRGDYGSNNNNNWQQQQQQQQYYGGGGNNMGNYPNNMYGMPYDTHYHNAPMHHGMGGMTYQDMMMVQQQQQQAFHAGGGNMPFGMQNFNNGAENNNNMDPADLLQFLLQQQQQQQGQGQQYPHPSSGGHASSPMPDLHHSDGNAVNSGDGVRVPNSAPAASRVLPSVEEFVPVVPKSLLSLVLGGPTAASGPADGAADAAAAGGGQMVLLEAPKIAPEADRRAREQRRAHITGFPNGTTREELEDYFRLLLPEVRRLMTEREIRQLAEETGLLKEEGEDAVRQVPANANLANIDLVKDVSVSQGKVKAFSFIELRLADMIDELVQQCQADPQRFLFTSAIDGRSYPLMIRRPRDTVPLTGVEESKVVMIGFPLSMPAETIKPVFESFGELLTFEVKNGFAYGEFKELRDATDFRADVHGLVLGNSMVIALPLYDWLKALLVREGLDITIADDDPVSGSYVMKQVRERLPDAVGGGAHGASSTAGGAGDDGSGGKSTALVIAEDPEAASLQIMRELLDMSYTLPDMLARFAALYPHVRPLYANTQLTVYPTPVLVLLNLFDEEELVFDAAYSQLLADIEEEVEQHGRVRRLIVPRREARPKLPEAPKAGVDYTDEDDVDGKAAAMAAYNEAKRNFGAVLGRYMNRQTHPVWGGYGRVFVEYETVDEAAEAQQQIAGKLFGERTVVTSFLYPDLLQEDDDEGAEKSVDKEESAGDEDADEKAEEDGVEPPEDQAGDGVGENGEEDETTGGGAESTEADDDVAESATSEHAEDID